MVYSWFQSTFWLVCGVVSASTLFHYSTFFQVNSVTALQSHHLIVLRGIIVQTEPDLLQSTHVNQEHLITGPPNPLYFRANCALQESIAKEPAE